MSSFEDITKSEKIAEASSEKHTFTCKVCKEGFNSKYNLLAHECILSSQKSVLCNNSVYQVSNPEEYSCLHTNILSCEICNEIFQEQSALMKHQEAHFKEASDSECNKNVIQETQPFDCTTEIFFTCQVCKKSFPKKDFLENHYCMRKRKFECNICHENFNNESVL